MNFLKHFNTKTLNNDLINKFQFVTTKKIPQIKKIILNIGCKTTDIKILAASLLALEFITEKAPKLTKAKKPVLILKIRKGNPVGCKITLHGKYMFNFLIKICTDIFPNIKNFLHLTKKTPKSNNSFSCQIKNILYFPEIEAYYNLFKNVPTLQITIVTNCKNSRELTFLIKSLGLPC
jgi:large subunit ribosomal protein L5